MDVNQIGAAIFVLVLSIVLYKNRKKIEFQKVLGPLLYFAMYRTKIGLPQMDKIAKRWPRVLKWYVNLSIFFGFIGMILIVVELLRVFYVNFFTETPIPGVGLVQPFVPGVKGTFYVPFFYFIICIFVVAAVHEFMHGVISRYYNVKVKSSGFACLGILAPLIPAAFVEPDERQLAKKPKKVKIGVFAAGPFANIVLAALVLLLLNFLLLPGLGNTKQIDGMEVVDYLRPDNMTLPAEEAGMKGELITHINGVDLRKFSGNEFENITEYLSTLNPGQQVKVTTNVTEHLLVLAENPDEPGNALMGVQPAILTSTKPDVIARYGNFLPAAFEWISALFVWLFVLNLAIGLFNLVPVGPVDGGRMFQVALQKFFKPKLAEKIWAYVGWTLLALLLLLIVSAFFA